MDAHTQSMFDQNNKHKGRDDTLDAENSNAEEGCLNSHIKKACEKNMSEVSGYHRQTIKQTVVDR